MSFQTSSFLVCDVSRLIKILAAIHKHLLLTDIFRCCCLHSCSRRFSRSLSIHDSNENCSQSHKEKGLHSVFVLSVK